VAALGVGLIVLLLVVLVQARRIGQLGGRLEGITRGERGRSLESILDAHLDKVYAVAAELDELAARSAVLEANGRRAFQRIGLVRFNPFQDTGGNQSFALALVDAHGDGFIVSSLHARTGTRIYAKALTGGQADAALSAEENEALRRALEAGDARGQRPVERATRGA
jgi:DNA-binding GntR family transcriptional regulator